ncbi:hypothetical protein LTR37_006776 [Vermiconidia calcicola]|uniref:Uncharacterized protein n=1 Tax=Vermiconidia calcicola TaxID=1690605 RepID=A0ACC3NII0_9PEZI|nr:hypothetical protein LTR37_006776 [Vermiconidia calcicola]
MPCSHSHSAASTAQGSMQGRYKVYKAGTKKLVDWLVNTGDRCCDLKAIIKSFQGRLPTKHDEAANKKFGTAAPTYELRTQELVKLTQAIVDSEPPVAVPENIIQVLQDVIAGRQECAEWYSSQALEKSGELAEENQSHRYFIMILQRIKELLLKARAKLPSGAEETKPKSTSGSKENRTAPQDTGDNTISNIFGCLRIEEPSPFPLGQEQPSGSSPSPATNFKLEKAENDTSFAIWCFLQDLNDVRVFVKGIWLEYTRGGISFLAASSTTDTAFGLLRCADAEFAASSNLQTTDWIKILEYFGLSFNTNGQVIWLCRNPETPKTEPPPVSSQMNIVDLLCPVAFLCIYSYSEEIRGTCEAERRRMKGEKNVTNPQPSHLHHFHEFCNVLWDLIPQLHYIAHTSLCEHIIIDEFVQGLVDVHRERKFPMWVVIACQIYLDLYDMLGNHIGHGVEALHKAFEKHRQVANDVLKYQEECKCDMEDVRDGVYTSDWADDAMDRFKETFDTSRKRIVKQVANSRIPEKEEKGYSTTAMERSLPAHAGAILTDLKIAMHRSGIQIANHGSYILAFAHLYKALRSKGVLNHEWHDMDMVLASFGSQHPLVAKAGSRFNSATAVRNFYHAIGLSPAQLKAKVDKVKHSPQGILESSRKLHITSALLAALSEREQVWEKRGSGHTKSKTVEVVLHALTASASEQKDKNARRKSQLRELFTPLQLLATFKKCIIADEPSLNFDYVGFMISCARLLTAIARKMHSTLQAIHGSDVPDDDYISFVASVLQSAPSDVLVTEVAESLQSHIAEHGKHFIKEAYDQSSGRIPKDARPTIQLDLESAEAARDLLCTLFDYSDTRYTFSGVAMAAYHPKIDMQPCSDTCCFQGQKKWQSQHLPQQRLTILGSTLPDYVVDEGLANLSKDPGKYLASRERLIRHTVEQHAQGKLSDVQLDVTMQCLEYFDYQIRRLVVNEGTVVM